MYFLLSFGYLLLFQLGGVLLAYSILRREGLFTRLILGIAAGNVLLMWLPALWAFLFRFSIAAHIAAPVTLFLLCAAVWIWKKPALPVISKMKIIQFLRANWDLCVPLGFWLLFSFLCMHGFRYENGELWSSQCTYGDMSMHLSFITSIARQGTFPPEYSLLPGVRLSYPFLSDSISSSLLLLGAPLRWAYLLPMFFAGFSVFFGAWLLLRTVFCDRRKTLLSMVLFFANGGFGFAYFLGGLQSDISNFTRIFTAFYQTPTNLTPENIRWVNVIVDILVPQRASLFGWAVLFPVLYLLYRAVFYKKKSYFPLVGIFAGAMVMIHTHSFLVLGLISGIWLAFSLAHMAFGRSRAAVFRYAKRIAAALLLVPVAMQIFVPTVLDRDSAFFLVLALAVVAAFVLLLVCLFWSAWQKAGWMALRGWGMYFCVTLLLAMPQLLIWTFTQAKGDSFVRGWYNWGNLQDNYLWFYIVNLGLFALFLVPAFFSARGRRFAFAAPAAVLWFLCEFVVFQPNTYDNNKILYIAYFLLCVPVADYLVELYCKLRDLPMRRVLAGICLFLFTFSAVLTVVRESRAGYCLFSRGQLAAAAFVEENAEPDDTILTDMRHNNEIAALTGRNIVCGSSSYLYFHGLDSAERVDDMRRMFSDPASSAELFEKYSVDFVMVSAYEENNFSASTAVFDTNFTCVYNADGFWLYRVKE